jgi:dihydrofolate synthase / folylpolyglutamate synthase
MTYQDAIEFLFTSLPMFQRVGNAAYKDNLDNSLALSSYFNESHTQFKSIHIAGTNGKGSVSHMLAAILQEAGFKTGLYTSPHLIDFRERIKINGTMIPQKEVVDFVLKHKSIINQISPSFFEMTVAMAFDYFAREKTDYVVVETGMGGRLDSTNIISPLLSVITNIGLDHTFYLGDTIPKIAQEKAGIIKEGVPVVIGEWQEETMAVFEKTAYAKNAEIHWADKHLKVGYSTMTPDRFRSVNVYENNALKYMNIVSSLPGKYQDKNIITVLKTIEILQNQGVPIPESAIYSGIKNVKSLTGLAGRWDEIAYNPLIVCDTAHNKEGMELVIQQILEIPWKKLHIVFGTVNDKDPEPVLKVLPKEAVYYFTKASIPRAMEPEKIKETAQLFDLKGEIFQNVNDAFLAAKQNASANDMIFIGGSTFVVGELLKNIN